MKNVESTWGKNEILKKLNDKLYYSIGWYDRHSRQSHTTASGRSSRKWILNLDLNFGLLRINLIFKLCENLPKARERQKRKFVQGIKSGERNIKKIIKVPHMVVLGVSILFLQFICVFFYLVCDCIAAWIVFWQIYSLVGRIPVALKRGSMWEL
jgi:hypothetical protein